MCFNDQKLPATVVLTSSANAVVPKHGSEAYDVSKSAVNQLIREFGHRHGPAGAREWHSAGDGGGRLDDVSARPGDQFSEKIQDRLHARAKAPTSFGAKLARFYAQRTLTRDPIMPDDCAEAIVFLASDLSSKTTGHVIPVDGGLPEAFLR